MLDALGHAPVVLPSINRSDALLRVDDITSRPAFLSQIRQIYRRDYALLSYSAVSSMA
jgi:hypothetical protein